MWRQVSAGTVSVPDAGAFESRTTTASAAKATSTQSALLPPALRLLLRQQRSDTIARLQSGLGDHLPDQPDRVRFVVRDIGEVTENQPSSVDILGFLELE
jgi:hypothetical protein